MKTNNKHSKHKYDSRLISSAALSFKLWLCVLCFTLLPLGLLKSLTDVAAANSAPDVRQKLLHSSLTVPTDPNGQNARKLWQAHISAATGQKNSKSETRLRQLIEQIHSVDLKPQKRAPEPVIVPDEIPVAEPNEAPSDTTTSKKDTILEKEEKRQIQTKLPYEPVAEQTLQMLRKLSQHPEKADNPLELGEVLFLSGQLKEAAIFYGEALKRRSPGDTNSAQDRAWILFQMGNCLRNHDRSAAAKMYGQLITEHPNSPWSELAEAQAKLIDWYQTDEPHKLIGEMEHIGSE